MGASPRYKVFTPSGEYTACTKHLEDAAAIVALYGHGSTIRLGHAKRDTIYTDGEDAEAADSVDEVAEIAGRNETALQRQRFEAAYGKSPRAT